METDDSLRVTPAPQMQGVEAYKVPPKNTRIDLPLGGTERAVLSTSLAHFSEEIGPEAVSSYPRSAELEELLAFRLGVPPAQVLVTAGADEALDRACRAVLTPGRNLVAPEPTFEMIPHYVRLTGATCRTVPWNGGSYPVEAVIAITDADTAAIAVVSPNNPTGAVATPQDLRDLATAVPHALLIADLAYIEFADCDLTSTVLELPNAVATRTLSKAWGTPGLRVGYALGQPKVIDWMRAAGGPYSVSTPSVMLAKARLESGDADVKAYVGCVRRERQELAELVDTLGGSTQPSESNFLLARFAKPAWVEDALAGLGIGVRTFPKVPSLAGAMRISCPGDEAAFARLRHGLKTALLPEALIFDLDGVLADVSGSYRQAIVQTAAQLGATITAADITAAKAAGDANNDWVVTHRLLAQKGVDVSLDEVTERFEQIYQGTDATPGLRSTEKLMPSASFIASLALRLPLAIVTGRPREDAERFLLDAGILEHFRVLVCMGDAEKPKPDPGGVHLCLERLSLGRAWMVGDTPDDICAARGAHVVPLGVVAPGDVPTAAQQSLRAAGAARVLTDLNELLELLP